MSTEEFQIDSLEILVKSRYLRIERNVNYHSIHGHGELDLVGLLPDYSWDVYEVKSNSKQSLINKAYRQLKRARKAWERRVNKTFIYIASTGNIIDSEDSRGDSYEYR